MERRPRESSVSFSALQMGLLRSYNHFVQQPPGTTDSVYQPYSPRLIEPHKGHNPRLFGSIDFSPVLGAFQPYTSIHFQSESFQECKANSSLISPLVVTSGSFYQRRPRGEKKAIPEEQKDDRYFERRKRNNQAAKKSRDARKLREDQIALRAAILEHENAMMRAQILTLREETQALRGMLLLTKKPNDTESTPALFSPLAPQKILLNDTK